LIGNRQSRQKIEALLQEISQAELTTEAWGTDRISHHQHISHPEGRVSRKQHLSRPSIVEN